MNQPTASASERILVVDDDELVRITVQTNLERAGYQVELASDGNKALAQMAKAPADLIILDVVMPEKEGIETLLQLKRDFGNTKVIVISSGGRMGLDDFLVIAERLGADAILKKPIRPQILIDTVRTVLGSRRSLSQASTL